MIVMSGCGQSVEDYARNAHQKAKISCKGFFHFQSIDFFEEIFL